MELHYEWKHNRGKYLGSILFFNLNLHHTGEQYHSFQFCFYFFVGLNMRFDVSWPASPAGGTLVRRTACPSSVCVEGPRHCRCRQHLSSLEPENQLFNRKLLPQSLKTTFRLMQIMYKRLETRKARRQRKKNLRKRMYPLQLKENNNPIINKSLRILYFRLIPRMLLKGDESFSCGGKEKQ